MKEINNHPIVSTSEYEYGWINDRDKLYYIIYNDIIVLDIDTDDINIICENIINLELSARIYNKFQGYRIFITSHTRKSQKGNDIVNIFGKYINSDKIPITSDIKYYDVIGINHEDEIILKLVSIYDKYLIKHNSF